MTCFSLGTLQGPEGFLTALAIGLAFGFWLERAGFGSSRRMAAIFYLRDFAVLKVMFTAIVTAALGLYALETAGVLSVEAIHRPPTFLWPQLIGGLVFGAGFVLGGWCPGTALVGLASGKLDALVFLGGAAAGSLAYALAYPALEGFATSGSWGVSTLPEVLGLSQGTVTVGVLGMALGAFAVATRVERRFGAPRPEEVRS